MWKYAAGAFSCCLAVYYAKKYFAGGVCRCTTRLDGKAIIVTGATSGIGKALSFELAKRGATLILSCRNITKADSVKESILKKYPTSKVFVKELDLNSFASINKFGETINKEFNEIYALVNNAGVFYYPQQLTEDGFDVTFQTNYLGPFILTHILSDILLNSEHSRIINVSSEAHKLVTYEELETITNHQAEPRNHFKAYGASKLALTLFTKQLSLKLSDTHILINAVDPGNVETDIFRHFPLLNNKFLFALQWGIRVLVIKTSYEGCQTILHQILTNDNVSGQYLTDCKPNIVNSAALNKEFQESYYKLTLKIIGSAFDVNNLNI